jgi:hypothetical protein
MKVAAALFSSFRLHKVRRFGQRKVGLICTTRKGAERATAPSMLIAVASICTTRSRVEPDMASLIAQGGSISSIRDQINWGTGR